MGAIGTKRPAMNSGELSDLGFGVTNFNNDKF